VTAAVRRLAPAGLFCPVTSSGPGVTPCGDTPCGRKAGYCPQRQQIRREHKSTKSRAGRRTVGLPDPLIKLLRQHHDEQEKERLAAGADWEGKGYVFASPTGGPLSPNTDFHVWKRLLRDAGVRDGRLHDARHTAATVLLILGAPDVVIDAIMGWEPGGAARMRARYMHVTGTMLRKVAQQVGDALWELPGGRRETTETETETGKRQRAGPLSWSGPLSWRRIRDSNS
jgi:integrase